jgi:tetratricopeptide (TPR) repeat protein
VYLLLDERGRAAEGAELFQRAAAAIRPLAAADDPDSCAARAALARLLSRQAAFLADLGEIAEAKALLADALPLLRTDGDRAELAFALGEQCWVLRNEGNYRAPEFEEALALYREAGDQRGMARALNTLGAAKHALGEYQEAKRLYRESIELYRRLGLATDAWPALNNLAGIALVDGDLQGARRILSANATTSAPSPSCSTTSAWWPTAPATTKRQFPCWRRARSWRERWGIAACSGIL